MKIDFSIIGKAVGKADKAISRFINTKAFKKGFDCFVIVGGGFLIWLYKDIADLQHVMDAYDGLDAEDKASAAVGRFLKNYNLSAGIEKED